MFQVRPVYSLIPDSGCRTVLTVGAVPCPRYDPYSKVFSQEYYDQARMVSVREAAVARAGSAAVFGVILGTLGRQGSPRVMRHLQASRRPGEGEGGAAMHVSRAVGCVWVVYTLSD